MHLAYRLVVLAFVAIGVRAAVGQQATPSPGQRGDPYSPLGPAPQVQTRYPLPPPQPGARPAGPVTEPAGPPAGRYPLPQPGAASQPQPQQASFAPPGTSPAPASGELFQPGQIVAEVGDQYILYGDVAPTVDQILTPVMSRVSSESERQELEQVRDNLTRQIVRQIVDSKLMYLEFLRQIEENAGRDKMPEIQKNIQRRMREDFEQELAAMRTQVAAANKEQLQKLMQRDPVLPRLSVLMKENGCETSNELDLVLRRFGSSLDKQLRFYSENKLGRSTVGKHVDFNPEITHQAMLDYYREHAAEFAIPAKARFEILSVKFASCSTKDQAWNKLAQMGNEVYFGAPLATIARKHSEEPNAQKGGYYDWITQGSLASKPVDQAVFTLEVNKLSQPIEDERGYHIVRVLERQEAGQVSFLEAQPGIKDAIKAHKREGEYKQYVETLRTSVKVWTIFDEQPQLARQPAPAGEPVPR
ncbi:MAG: peptidylprolyl isomerase [Pirellulaceae bacterium]